ncbi:MAG: RNA-binding protein [Patescibacteria group bacterium]|jgi:RNA recognition motif-containing protein
MESEKNKLFVGNLSFDIDQEQLASLFAEIDGVEVVEATIIMDRETNRPRGFGFVKVATDEMAEKAVAALDGKEVAGRKIVVNIAKPREERPRTGGQGGYSRDRRY